MYIRVRSLQRRIEIAHYIAELWQSIVFMNHIKHGCVIFIDKDDNLLASHLMYVAYKVTKSNIRIGGIGGQTKTTFILFQNK